MERNTGKMQNIMELIREALMIERDPFREYEKQKEPDKYERSYIWQTAIGLQDVDGLTPSDYLIQTALRNIEGEISVDEAQELLNTYYETKPQNDDEGRRKQIRFLPALLSCCQRKVSVSHHMNICQFIESFLQGYTSMQEKSEAPISPNGNGFSKAIL